MKLFFICLLSTIYWNCESASYYGTSANDAAIYLDNSQNVRGFGFSNRGHPRDHSSSYSAPSYYASVENYSIKTGQMKSGFDSRDIQNEVAHRVLTHPKVQGALYMLNLYNFHTNNGQKFKRQDIKLFKAELNLPKSLTGGEWVNGQKVQNFPIRGAVIVLQHFEGRETDPYAPVHIQTLYPLK